MKGVVVHVRQGQTNGSSSVRPHHLPNNTHAGEGQKDLTISFWRRTVTQLGCSPSILGQTEIFAVKHLERCK
jgi:hypothetical protein